MKGLLLISLAGLCIGSPLHAQTPQVVFIVVTTECKWPDGLRSVAGEVERVIDTDADNYIIWHPSGIRYPLPKRFAVLISNDEAAIRLIERRQQLYSQLAAPLQQQPSQQQTLTQAPSPPIQTPYPRVSDISLINMVRDIIREEQDSRTPPVSQLPPHQASVLDSLFQKYGQPAALTTAGAKVYKLSNSITPADIQKRLGVTEPVAAKLATLAASNVGRRSGVFLVATGATFAAIQVFDDGTVSVIDTERPWLKQYRWLVAIAVGIGAVLLYMKLQKVGIFRQQ